MSAWYPSPSPRWRRYLRFWRADIHADTDEELRLHLESRIEDLIRDGFPRADAAARANEEFGDFSRYRTDLMSIDSRIARRADRMEEVRGLLGDFAYAARALRRAPGMTITIIATLALGVGANAAMFTLLNAVFLRPPAGVLDPGGVTRVWAEREFSGGARFSTVMGYSHYAAAVDALRDRARVAIYRAPFDERIGTGEDAPMAQLGLANSDYFGFVGAHASVGRFFSPAEDALDATEPVAVISDAYWHRAFDGDPSVIGRSITVGGVKQTIIGVAAAPFVGVDLNAADIWLPLGFLARSRGARGAWWTNPNVNGFTVLVRPLPAADRREIETRLTTAFRRPGVGYGTDTSTVVRLGSIVAANGPGERSQEVRIAVRLAAVAAIVLFIACANVINLLLARAMRRRREIAVRLALGSSRWRLLRLMIAESSLLAVCSAVVALTIAYLGGALLRTLLLPEVHWSTSPVDWTVSLFALGVALLAGLVAGLVPALRSASPELTHALRAGAGVGAAHGSRLRSALVVVQAALSVVLLVGAVLFVRSLANIRSLGIGFDSERLMTAAVSYTDRSRYADPTLPARIVELSSRIAQLPGVERVALSSARPMYSMTWISYFTDTDSLGSRRDWRPTVTAVSPGYFAASGTRMLRGRDFDAGAAGAGAASVIVNEETAAGLWPGRDPVGQCMRFGTRGGECHRVIGVVENTRQSTLLEHPQPQYYLPFAHLPDSARAEFRGPAIVMIRIEPGQAVPVANRVRTLMRMEFPGALPSIVRLSDYLDPQYRPWRLGATLFSLFGVLALVVAIVGMYGTVSYGVSQRMQEFGIRMALGARVGDVLRLIVGQSLRIVSVGVALGIVLSLALGRFVASLLYGVAPSDMPSLAVVGVVLLAAGAIAALVPAWRAGRVDPASTLRSE